MTRDQALTIAKRLMRRIEDDQAIHLDSLADELVMATMPAQKPIPEARMHEIFAEMWMREIK